jgi:short-subunit dehydrogenase
MTRFALITGASKGIGNAIAWQLAAKQYNLILVARSGTLLDQLAAAIKAKHNIKVETLVADLTKPEQALKTIQQWHALHNLPISILVNNAGFGRWGYFEKLTLSEQIDMMSLNMNALVSLTYFMIPVLKQHGPAYVLNVSSTTAYQAVPTMSVYAATKSFVLSFSRGLRHELSNTNISVTCLCPGTTRTQFMDAAGMESLKKTAEKVEMSAEEVARIGLKGMFGKKAEVIPGFINYFSAALTALVPKKWVETIAANIYKIK